MNAAAAVTSSLDLLDAYDSVAALRRAVLAARPAFDPARLTRLAILGAGPEGRRLAACCAARGIEVVAVFDGNATKRGMPFGTCRVMPSDALGSLDRSVPVIVASHRVLGAIDLLAGLGFEAAPFALLQLLDPEAFPPHMFYTAMLEDLHANRARYRALAASLADDESRRVLDRVLAYRLSMDPRVMREAIDWDLYCGSGLFEFGTDEVYVDGGSFDGDSVRLFIEHVGGKFSRALAFEPDPATFERLCASFANEPRVQTHNCGLHRQQGELRFDNDSTRGAIFSDTGSVVVPVVGLDEVLAGQRVSFIKMNIEGSELEALRGAALSIASFRPKLAISAYHRPSDLWQIPELVRSLHADYHLYLRQHDGGVIETVLYAC
ncbi:MAG: FkbM family methyltransferase [Gammaproteobacteria bacterium]|nr:FkbM family methyltransferase [Gammaproteobacteria bacterium]